MKLRKWVSDNSIPIMSVVLFGVWSFGYFFIGQNIDPEQGISLATPADERIPYVGLFIYPYLALYPLFLMPFFLVRDREFFRVFAWSYITVMVFCYLIFWNFPVTMYHPQIEVTDFTTWALSVLYGADPPVNCFPSMHAAMALMAALTIYAIDRVQGAFALFVTFMIGIAALLIKQHYIADILGGFAISAIIYYIYFKQRIHETLARDFKRRYAAIDHYVEEILEKRLDAIIDYRVEERIKKIMSTFNQRQTAEKKEEDKSSDST